MEANQDFSDFSGAEEVNLNEPPRPLMREMPPAAVYPIDALGPIMSGAVKGIQDKTQAALPLCAQSVMASCALAAQLHNDVVLPTGQTRPTSVFAISVAGSGDRKSSADDIAIGPIVKREKKLREQYDKDAFTYATKKAAWDKAKDAILKRKDADRTAVECDLMNLGPPPEAPLEPLLMAPEPTFEGLCKLLAIGQPGIGLFAGEGGQFISGHAMNSDNRIKTAAGLSTLWDCGTAKRVRSGDGAITLSGRRVSLHLLTQPGVALEMLGDAALVDQGLLSRILVAAPDSLAGTRLWREPKPESEAAIQEYSTVVLSILEASMPLAEGKTNELEPAKLEFTSGARKVWIAFADNIESQIGHSGKLEAVRGFANKAAEHAARLAAIITTIELKQIDGGEIGGDGVERGIEIVRYHIAEALRLFEATQANADLVAAQKLLGWLQSTWRESLISLPEIYRLGPNSIRSKSVASKLVNILADHGWLLDAGPGEVNGVKRRETFRIVH